jgi:hypothetical protein
MTLRKLVPIALLTALALGAAARPAHSASAAPDTVGLPYVTQIHTLPVQPCPTQPTRIVVEGVFPTPCGKVLGHDSDTRTIYFSSPAPSCVRCPGDPVLWADTLDVGFLQAGYHSMVLTLAEVDSCTSPPTITNHQDVFTFAVTLDCEPPNPIRYVEYVGIERAHAPIPCPDDSIRVMSGGTLLDDCSARPICPNDSILVRFGGTFPDNCRRLRRINLLPMYLTPLPQPPIVQLVFDNLCCADMLCMPGPVSWVAGVTLPPLPTNNYWLITEAVEVCCRDTVLPDDPRGTRTDPFRVTTPDSCGVDSAACVRTHWDHTSNVGGCDAMIDVEGRASLTMIARSRVPLSALQGRIGVTEVHASQIPLPIASIEAVGAAAGFQVAWEPTANGAEFVMFTTGAPIPASSAEESGYPVLRVTFQSVPVLVYDPDLRWYAQVIELFGSDPNGEGVPDCVTDRRHYADVGVICLGGGTCELNGDGRTDVRDLVRMVNCLYGIGPCPTNPDTTLDCDGNGDFDLDDVLCCAYRVLDRPWTGGDSSRSEPAISVQFGTPVRTESGFDIPMRLEGADRVGAARIALSMPDALAAGATVTVASGGSNWLKLNQARAGQQVIGLIDITSPAILALRPATLDLVLHVPAPVADAQITVAAAEFSARDGVQLVADLGAPAVRIGAGVTLALSAARPNPFNASTEFRLSLDAPADVDVGVYDLAGRRVAGLHHGRLEVGVHRFTWDGRAEDGGRVGAGVYFARASSGSANQVRKLILVQAR